MRSREFRLTVNLLHQPDPARPSRNEPIIDSEMFRYLSMDPRHSRYAQRVIGDINGALAPRRPPARRREHLRPRPRSRTPREDVRVGSRDPGRHAAERRWRAARHALRVRGDDPSATLTDAIYIGADNIEPGLRTGLFTLRTSTTISIVAAPGRTSARLQSALIAHCELMRYRFAVLDGRAPPADTITDVQLSGSSSTPSTPRSTTRGC